MDISRGRTKRRPLAIAHGDDRLLWDLHASENYLLWLAAADELHLFSMLEEAPANPQEIAARLKIGVVTTEGLLGVLAALGFLTQHDYRFSLTQTARDFLLPSSLYYRGSWLEAVRRRPRVTYDTVYAALREDQVINPFYWDPSKAEPLQTDALVRAPHCLSFASGPALAERGDFSWVHRLLDVGGGAGGMSIALALKYPEFQCTVLDHEVACAMATEYITAHGVDEQVDTLVLSAFDDPWPMGYDAVLFSHLLDCFDEGVLSTARPESL